MSLVEPSGGWRRNGPKVRVKITNQATHEDVYDNRRGASDDMDQANPQAIAGGSIVIHKP